MHLRALLAILVVAIAPYAHAAAPSLDRQFQQTVRPFVNKYCIGCHSGSTPAAQFDLKSYGTMDAVMQDFPRWLLVMEKLTAGQMPPKPVPPPPAEARQQVIGWIQAVRAEELRKSAGDPGMVLPRRLSNAEYSYTIRDLTGQDLQPTREFPLDPDNQAGFDNSGESLTMSPALLSKYLQAARGVAEHLVLKPDGFDFAPYPMLVETDRDKYCIQRILDFYKRQPTDYADYFQAAWRYEHRAALGKPGATLESVAAESKVSAKYLPLVWQILHDPEALGPVAKLEVMWRALPEPGAEAPDALHAQCVAMRDFVVKIRQHTAMQFAAPVVKGLPPGSQPLLNWKLRAFASHRRESDPNDLRNDTDPPPVVPAIPKYPGLHKEAAPRWAALSAKARAGDTDLIVPAADRSRYEAAFERFASVFPDTFYVSERGRYFPDDSQDKGRFLSAGYHNTMGYFRDDTPLSELILDEDGQRELNRLWDEFDFIGKYTERTWVQYYINQSGEVQGKGAESGSPRPEDHQITDAEVIERMKQAYLAKAAANPANDPIAPQAIRDHFDMVNATLRGLEKEHAQAEPKHLNALLDFAARAYRRPLLQSERDGLLAYYHELREKNEMSHDDAMRGSIVAVLMSPDFLYRIDLLDPGMGSAAPGTRATIRKTSSTLPMRPLSPYALASRLSYFLWASMPDAELLQHAAAGDLEKPEVLLAETHRMLQDERVRGLAAEFGGNWLDFRHFETSNTVDRQRFPQFNDDLREAMYQEPIRFLEDMARSDSSVLDMIYGRYTFVNPVLARHYGIPNVTGAADTWVRVDDADKYGRGGLLPMAVFLTENAPGLRTSPVKRGVWVVHRVLGETIPSPPPVVPELPQDEAKSNLPIRDELVQHRANPICASCHARFDDYGLAFEGYGPVGETRTKDLAGRPVDTAVTFPGGGHGLGLEAVENYIRERRQADFVDNLSRKLLAYALNRSLQLSDETLVQEMETRLRARDYRFSVLVDAIVASPQFLNARMPNSAHSASHETAAEEPRR
jgi:hypothetical protein